MRILKDTAMALLEQEIQALERQCQACYRQANRFASFQAEGMKGRASAAAERRVHMLSAVIHAHLVFYQAVIDADRRNLQLVRRLATTSAGVVDTAEAQERADLARARIEELSAERDRLLSRRRVSRDAVTLGFPNPSGYSATVGAHAFYQRLIERSQKELRDCEQLIEQVARYQQESLSLYRSVDGTTLQRAVDSSRGYVWGRGWGDVSWVQDVSFALSVRTYQTRATLPPPKSPLERFLLGEIAYSESAASTKAKQGFEFFGAPLVGTAEGDLVGIEAFLKPYGAATKATKNSKEDITGIIGAEAGLDFHLVRGAVRLEGEMAQGTAEARLLSGSATAVLGASVGNDNPLPSFVAKAEGKSAALAGSSSVQVGGSDLNYHLKAKGEALTSDLKFGLSAGVDGWEAKLGAESYAATGEISGGISLFGLKLDTTLSAKLGGAGGNAGASLAPSSVEGELGLGLGIGVGVKAKLDWSGVLKQVPAAEDAVASWWNGLFEGKE